MVATNHLPTTAPVGAVKLPSVLLVKSKHRDPVASGTTLVCAATGQTQIVDVALCDIGNTLRRVGGVAWTDVSELMGRPAIYLDIVHAPAPIVARDKQSTKRRATGTGPGLWVGLAPGAERKARLRSAGRTPWPRTPHGGIKPRPDVRFNPSVPHPDREAPIAVLCAQLTAKRHATARRDVDVPWKMLV